MKTKLREGAITHTREVLGASLVCAPWKGFDTLPYHLKNAYQVELCEIMGRTFLCFFAQDPDLTPAPIEKHLNWVEDKTGLRGILVTETLESYNRKRLVERRVPFIVPGYQLYLPDLGVDLREHLKKARRPTQKLAPTSQLVVLGFLLGHLNESGALSPTNLAKHYHYTKMTMSRALEELKALELMHATGTGKSARNDFLYEGRALWERVKPYLCSPVMKRVYLETLLMKPVFRAGELALAKQTFLSAPSREVIALTSKEWKMLQDEPQLRIIPNASKEMAGAEVELWRYAPHLLAEPPYVDPLSLVLSMEHETDERVEMAVESIMETIKW